MSGRLRICSRTVTAVTVIVTVAVAASTRGVRGADDARMRIVYHGYVDRQPRSATAVVEGSRLTNMVDLPFLRAGGEISPDGTRIAFDTCARADREIRIAQLDGRQERKVVPLRHDEPCVAIRWSPDGTRLSYASVVDLQLHIVQLDTGVDTPRPETSWAGWHSWSPRGDAIVYQTGRGGSRRIDIVDLATASPRSLVGPLQLGACEVWAPDWSPAGDRIAFTSCDQKLYIVNADGTGLRAVAVSAYAPRWSVDGKSLLFLSGGMLMRVAADAEGLQQIGTLRYQGGPFSVGPVQVGFSQDSDAARR
jgi:Tol biopolymer transport system component